MSISSGPAWFSNFSFLKSSFSCHSAFFLFIKSTKLFFFFPICFQAYYVYVESSRSHLKYVLSHKGLPWSPSSNQSLYYFLSLGTIHFSLQGSSLFDCMCIHQFSSVAQLCPLFAAPSAATCQASLSITNSRSPPKLMSIVSVMSSSHLILCPPLLILPSIFPSIRFFSNESALHIRWPKYWSFSFSISPSNENPGLISFRIDWLDLLAVQRTLRSLLQHQSSKASILRHSAS